MAKNESGLLQEEYLRLMDNTECPLLYHRWTIISIVGALMGRRVHISFGPEKIYPNQYVVLLGPAASRKSTAIKLGGDVMRATGYEKFAGDKTSSEKFISDLAIGLDNANNDQIDAINIFDTGTTTSEGFIKAGELEDFMGPSNGEFISLLTNLWDNLPHYRHRLKTKQSEICYKPTISLLGGATQTTFATIFPPGVVGQGMLSRMILVYGKGARKKISWMQDLDRDLKDSIINILTEISELEGEVTVDNDCKALLDKIYKGWKELDDERFENYSGRRYTHLLKLCIVVAASNLRLNLTTDDILYANTVLNYTEQFMSKAIGEFGHSEDSKQLHAVLRIIRKHPEGLLPPELIKVTAPLALRHQKLIEIVDTLRKMGKLDQIAIDKEDGKTVHKYIATYEYSDNSDYYCDYTWLKEYHEELDESSPEEVAEGNIKDEFDAAKKQVDTGEVDGHFTIQ